MQVSSEVKQQVTTTLQSCIDVANKHYGVDIQFPTVVYKKRGSTAGTANYGTNTIDLNPVLLMNNIDAFMKRTVPHEMAHLITDEIDPKSHQSFLGRKRQPHGKTWKSVMRVLGADPSRCHDYDVSSVERKRSSYEYKCEECGENLTMGVKRHNKQQRALRSGLNAYSHSGCKGAKLIWVTGDFTPVRKIAADAPTQPKRQQEPTKIRVSKKTTAITIFNNENGHEGTHRAKIIKRYMTELEMSTAGASTYYSNIKKGTWA